MRSLEGIPLAQVAAGGAHSFALSLSGAVFGWGMNNAGQLGLSDEEGKQTLYMCLFFCSKAQLICLTHAS